MRAPRFRYFGRHSPTGYEFVLQVHAVFGWWITIARVARRDAVRDGILGALGDAVVREAWEQDLARRKC